ncbi:MAG: rod shape-determining protein MreD [Armatimonadetes bacterium]|nr:rod shape-determining protein MreD [Armatimonadota bacterium]
MGLRIAVYAGLMVVADALHTTWLVRVALGGAVLDPLLLLVLAAGVYRGPEAGAVLGLCAGFLQDLMGGLSLGIFALARLVVGFLVGVVSTSLYLEAALVPLAVAFAGTWAQQAMWAGVGWTTGVLTVSPGDWAVRTAVQAVMNAAAAPGVFWMFRRLDAWVTPLSRRAR